MRKIKSQITIFMVVGLVILIGGAIFFYLTSKAPTQFKPEIKIVQEQIPLEFDPIKKYANDCAYSLGVEGLKIIGKQGGYISFTDSSLNREIFTITSQPTESDAVSFTKNSNLKIPYWWYLKSDNNCEGKCIFASKRPDLSQTENSIEKQLERYINSKFKDCVKDFEPFIEQGFKISEAGKLRTDVTIASDDVVVLVEYPLNVEKGDVKKKITQFLVSIPVHLDKIYALATKITNLEMEHKYLEKHVLNLLVAFSGVREDKLPPMSDMQFKFGSAESWRKKEVKSMITSMLPSYIQLFQVDGAYNYERNFFSSELKQRLYDSTIIPVANSTFENLAAQFTYLDFWPVYFDLNCGGDKCSPSSVNSLLQFFGIQTYRFAYDLSFPVLVEIQEPFALENRGYSFNFFLEANIRNNKPMPVDFVPLEMASLSERSMLCDIRNSGNITVNVIDAATKKPVDDAQVLYTLIGESCFIGSTDSNGIVKEQFPIGVGGFVNVLKEDYVGRVAEFEPRVDAEDALKVEIQPVYTKNLIVKKKSFAKTSSGWQFVDTPADLNSKETAIITLTRIKDENELEFSSIGEYEGQQKEQSNASERSETRSQLTEIKIAPGDYTLDISMILNERIVIPEKEKCVKTGIFGSKECFKIQKMDFGEKSTPGEEKFTEGGLKLNITITPEDMQKGNTIVIYAIDNGIAGVPEQEREIQDLEQIGKVEEYSSIYQLALNPTFQ